MKHFHFAWVLSYVRRGFFFQRIKKTRMCFGNSVNYTCFLSFLVCSLRKPEKKSSSRNWGLFRYLLQRMPGIFVHKFGNQLSPIVTVNSPNGLVLKLGLEKEMTLFALLMAGRSFWIITLLVLGKF